jgi:hypothetical protein
MLSGENTEKAYSTLEATRLVKIRIEDSKLM